jgi:hypothetical protein
MNIKLKTMRIVGVLWLCGLVGCTSVRNETSQPQGKWTVEQANAWYAGQPWLVGCNFTPSSAINQLETWQADTWDPVTIDRELGWAEQLGFTSVRVFLHDLLWEQDHEGFLKRMDEFLAIADKHHIGVMFVLFDGVWDPFPKLGKQREPQPYVHNSGWVQSPGANALTNLTDRVRLKEYVQGVVGHCRDDRRVQVWDVFNEPDNPVSQYPKTANKAEAALVLLKDTFVWAREAHPSQPLTSGVWWHDWSNPAKLSPMDRFQLEQSDVISFHCYGKPEEMQKRVESLRRYGRPLLCTEYMARPVGSRFDPILGYLKQQHVGAYNWGFVDGKTQTIYPWDSWEKKYAGEPNPWFHDVLRRDGSPYDANEVKYIKSVTKKEK